MKLNYFIITFLIFGCNNASDLVKLDDGTYQSTVNINDTIKLSKYYDENINLTAKIFLNQQNGNSQAYVFENNKLIITEFKNVTKRDFIFYKSFTSAGELESTFLRTFNNSNLIQKDYYKNGKIKNIKYFIEGNDTINSVIVFDESGVESEYSNYIKIKYLHDTLFLYPTRFKNSNFLTASAYAFTNKKCEEEFFGFRQDKNKSLKIPMANFKRKISNDIFLKIKYFWFDNLKNEKWSETQYVEIKDLKNPPQDNLFYIKK